VHLVAAKSGRLCARDGVPPPGARHAVDARLPALLAVPRGRLCNEPRLRSAEAERDVAGFREPLVQRLPSAAKQHRYVVSSERVSDCRRPPSCAAWRRGSTRRISR